MNPAVIQPHFCTEFSAHTEIAAESVSDCQFSLRGLRVETKLLQQAMLPSGCQSEFQSSIHH